MGAFDDIVIPWDGKEYKVAITDTFDLVARIEGTRLFWPEGPFMSVSTLASSPPASMVAKAYAVALRYAGCKITDVQVLRALKRNQAEIKRGLENIFAAIMPPEVGSEKPNPPDRRRKGA